LQPILLFGVAATDEFRARVIDLRRSRVDDEALVDEARRRRPQPPSRRELIAATLTSTASLGGAIAFALRASSHRPLDWAVAALLALSLGALSQLEFEVGSGSAVPTQLAFVPMLFLLPLRFVPLLVCGAFLLGGAGDLARGRLAPARALTLVSSTWFALPPALVLHWHGEPAAAWSLWPTFLAALLAQFAGDFGHAAFHERLAHDLSPRQLVAPLLRVYFFDALLSPVALAVVAPRGRFIFLALLPIVVIFIAVGRERRARLDAALEAARLDALAHTDSLTGLANRRAWERHLATSLGNAASHPFTVCILDMDRFKEYNDEHGHSAGDALLTETASAWRALLRPHQLLARLGGDEFALALPTCDAATARRIVDEFCAVVPHGQICSAGLASHQAGESASALMKRADTALYTEKRSGRARATAL
jgi:diguanylate cyclase (GGDEF)-like protein